MTLVAALSPACFGQAGKAELFGTIQDPSGLGVAGAKVSGEDLATGLRIDGTTSEQGEYHLLGLTSGGYALTVEKPGFRDYRQTGITLRIGDQTRLDVRLELGQPTQSVNVNAKTSLLETANGSVNYHVAGTEVETLPLDGRNFIPLIALSPGVALPGGGSLLPRINGSRPAHQRIHVRRNQRPATRARPGGVLSDHRRYAGVQAQHQRVFAGIRQIKRRDRDGDRQIGQQRVPRHAV